jgi:uncharacterized protein (TIGR02145 family)
MTGEVRFVLVNDYDSGNLYSVSDTFGLYFTYFVPTLTSLTPAQCAAMTTFDGTNTTAVIAMLDDTDTSADKYYAVAKLNDGRCWMLSNYAKEYGALITNLSQGWTTSAGLSQAFYADAGNAASSINGTRACTGVGYATTPADAITFLSNSGSATAGSIHNCGYLYSWFGATAGTGIGTMTSTIATDSICPTGWHLPTAANVGTIPNADWGTDRNEFTTMYSNIGGTYAKTVGASSVFRGVHSGLTYTDTSYFLSYQGSQGYLWSSSATATASNAYLFNFSTSVVTPAFATNTYKYYGRAVRCILNAN